MAPRTQRRLLGALVATLLVNTVVAQGAFPTLNTADTSVIGATATSDSSAAASTNTATSNTAGSTAASNTNTAPTSSGTFVLSTTATTNVPTNSAGNPAFPTLAGVGVPDLIVPDTSGATYMQRSSLPEGTVFICVGAILGFLGACVLAWHGLVAWSIHRSVQRAAKTSHGPDAKSIFSLGSLGNNGPAYQSMYAQSQLSLDNLGRKSTAYAGAGAALGHERSPSRTRAAADKEKRKSRAQSSQSGLFFSPTANTGPNTSRNSAHMPPGFYAAGSAQMPGSHANQGYGRMPSMDGNSTLAGSRPASRHIRPGSAGNALGGAAAGGDGRRGSRLNPDARTGHSPSPSYSGSGVVRAPSQYMEDLFSEHGTGRSGERS